MKVPRAAVALALAMASTCAGCASGVRAEQMVPDEFTVLHRHRRAVSVSCGGGEETSAFWGQTRSSARSACS
jgi:hypothetical protein